MSSTKSVPAISALTIAVILVATPHALRAQTENESELRSNIQKIEQSQEAGQSFEAADDATERDRGEEALQEYLAAKLVLDNYSKIRLAELAAQRAQFEPVQRLAEAIAQDHRQLISELEQIVPISDLFKIGPADVVPQPAALETDQPGQRRAGQATAQQSTGEQDERTTPQEATPLLQAGFTHQLLRIDQEAAAKHLQMSNEMLRQYEGQDFDMAFLSHQVVTHTRMLAELEAMQGVGTQEFQTALQRAKEATQSHLEKTKQLAKRFEEDRARSAQNPSSAGSRRSTNRQ